MTDSVVRYYEVHRRNRADPVNLFVLRIGSPRTDALLWSHPAQEWTYDPLSVQLRLTEDLDEEPGLVREVTRQRAEEVAAVLGGPLPTETRLLELLSPTPA